VDGSNWSNSKSDRFITDGPGTANGAFSVFDDATTRGTHAKVSAYIVHHRSRNTTCTTNRLRDQSRILEQPCPSAQSFREAYYIVEAFPVVTIIRGNCHTNWFPKESPSIISIASNNLNPIKYYYSIF
jgi:hypothetical protein